MPKKYKICLLSAKFFQDYPASNFPELELKSDRPYLVYLIQIKNNTFAVPFRSNIAHNYCYKFTNSNRQTKNATGLDFTKAVVLRDNSDIGAPAKIDHKEYLELSQRQSLIYKRFASYVKNYYRFTQGELNEYQAKAYCFTTLRYFHKELQIEQSK